MELSLDQKKALALAGARKRKAEAETETAPTEGKFGGVGFNATAGLNEAIYSTIGAPVDLTRGALNLGIKGVNAVTGADIKELPSDGVMGSEWVGDQLGKVAPVLDADNTEANTAAEKISRGVGQGAGYTIAPEAALATLVKTGKLAGPMVEGLTKIFGAGKAPVANATVGGVSGGSATAAMEAVPDEYKPLAGVVGGIVGGAGAVSAASAARNAAQPVKKLVKNAVAPLSQGGRERLAGDILQDGATDPVALRKSLDEGVETLVPGSEPTTFQATGDMGIGGMERGAQTRKPELFNQRRADQNAARIQSLESVQDAGAPEAVASAVRDRMQQIDDVTQSTIESATNAAREAADVAGTGMLADDAGAAIRGTLESARAAAKKQERALWDAVDPDKTLALSTTNTKELARSAVKDTPVSARPASGEEAAIFAQANRYGQVVPFKEVTALQSRIKTELRAERLANGESPAYRRLSQLNAAIQNDLDTAISGKVEQEARAVALGMMDEEATMMARLQSNVDGWFAERLVRADTAGAGPSAFQGGSSGSQATSGVSGAKGEAGRQFNGYPSDPSLPPENANFDADALGRLNKARQSTKDRVETFDNKVLGPIRKRPSTVSPYDVQDSKVPSKIFVAGPSGAETIKTYRDAVGDDTALDVIREHVVEKLRADALRPDGTLAPMRVTSFRKKYADALREFPELDKQFADAATASDTLALVTRQQQKVVADAKTGVLGKLIGVDDPGDVTRTVGSVFSAQDSAKRMARISEAIADNPEAKEGLRKAVADHIANKFVSNAEAGTSGVKAMKPDGFQSFVRNNKPALSNAGFTDAEISQFGRLAGDLRRSNRSITAVKNPGGSNTAQDALKANEGASVLSKVVSQLGMPGVGATVGFNFGGPAGAAVGAVGAGIIAELRRQGLEKVDDILADALLHPDRARLLLKKATKPRDVEKITEALARSFRRTPTVSAGVTMEERGNSDN